MGCRAVPVCSRGSDHRKALLAEALNAKLDVVARAEIARRLHSVADSPWGASGNDIARLEGHEPAYLTHQERPENIMLRVLLLWQRWPPTSSQMLSDADRESHRA
jgi:hypothetical protein